MAALARAVLPVVATLLVGQLATLPNLVPWYQGLAKPAFNPPNALFGPTWSLLYALMAVAAWRLLRLPPDRPGRPAALAAFYAQLALNAAWPWLFFALHSPALGLVDIVPQLLLVGLAVATAWRVDRIAASCLVPLLAWVGFATALNLAILRLN